MGLKHSLFLILPLLTLSSVRLVAQQPAPMGTSIAEFAAKRYPQPVRVGDLIHRLVLEPGEQRTILGHVAQVVRTRDGKEAIVMDYGGWFGFGTRPIAVPTDAMVLLGSELEVLDFTPDQLRGFPSYLGAGAVPLAPDDMIRMGLAHPSH